MRSEQSTFEIDATLRSIARNQLGLLTVAQAARAGIDRWALARRRATGALEAIFASVMRLAANPANPEQTILAAALAVPGSTIVGTSAAVAHCLPVAATRHQPMVAVGMQRSARTAGIITIRQHIEMPSQRWHNSRLATPASTILVLPRFVGDGVVERCVDHCLANRLTTVEKVQGLILSLPPRSVVGRRLLLDLLAQRTSGFGHRSGLEQQVARWLNAAGLRGWHRNFAASVGNCRTVEVDFAWPQAKLALEVSPFFTHGARVTQERDIERRRLLVVQGWRIVEATDPDLQAEEKFERCIALVRVLLGNAPSRALPQAAPRSRR